MSQGSLKNLCHSWEYSCCLWGFTEARSVPQKSFIMFCLDFVLFGSPPFHFSNSSSNFRAVSLFCFCSLWLSMTSLTSLLFVSFLHLSSSLRQPLHCLLHHHSFCSGCLVRRCHLFFDCVPALSESSSSVIHLVSVWKGQGQLQKLLQKLRSLTVDVSNDCFPVHWWVPLCKKC